MNIDFEIENKTDNSSKNRNTPRDQRAGAISLNIKSKDISLNKSGRMTNKFDESQMTIGSQHLQNIHSAGFHPKQNSEIYNDIILKLDGVVNTQTSEDDAIGIELYDNVFYDKKLQNFSSDGSPLLFIKKRYNHDQSIGM